MLDLILQVCSVVIAVSFTSMVAAGSLCVVWMALKVLVGRDT
jgi:hypothetical protein